MSDIVEPLPALSVKHYIQTEKKVPNHDKDPEEGNVQCLEVSSSTCSLTVQQSNNTGITRIWDKKHYCIFCGASSSDIRKHFFGPHKMEPEVQTILSFSLGSNERKLELQKLQNAGDYKHNTEVLRNGKGVLNTTKRNKMETSADEYLPCEHCLDFIVDSCLWRHNKNVR